MKLNNKIATSVITAIASACLITPTANASTIIAPNTANTKDVFNIKASDKPIFTQNRPDDADIAEATPEMLKSANNVECDMKSAHYTDDRWGMWALCDIQSGQGTLAVQCFQDGKYYYNPNWVNPGLWWLEAICPSNKGPATGNWYPMSR